MKLAISKKEMFFIILFCVFVLHTVINLEKLLFVNELFSLVGAVLFIIELINTRLDRVPKMKLIVFILISYGSFYALISFFMLRDGDVYDYLRTLPLWYSIFGFYLGMKFMKCKQIRGNIFPNNPQSVFLFLLCLVFPGRLSNQLLIPFLFTRSKNYHVIMLGLLAIFVLWKGGSTSYVLLFVFLFYIMISHFQKMRALFINKTVLVCGVVTFFSIIAYVNANFYDDFVKFGYAFLGNDVDNNSLWRLMFWVQQFRDNVVHNPIFGIGFGTKLFDLDMIPDFITSDDGTRRTPYTLGMHNSFYFVLIRLGMVGLILILIMFIFTFRLANDGKRFTYPKIEPFLLALIIMSISAAFNVILESPLYSTIFWIVFGMTYQVLISPRVNFLKSSRSLCYPNVG